MEVCFPSYKFSKIQPIFTANHIFSCILTRFRSFSPQGSRNSPRIRVRKMLKPIEIIDFLWILNILQSILGQLRRVELDLMGWSRGPDFAAILQISLSEHTQMKLISFEEMSKVTFPHENDLDSNQRCLGFQNGALHRILIQIFLARSLGLGNHCLRIHNLKK